MRFTGFVIACALSYPVLATPPVPSIYPSGSLRADGSTLRDNRNRPIILYGAKADVSLLAISDGDIQGMFFTMRSMNMNATRVTLSLEDWERDQDRSLARAARVAEIAFAQQMLLILALTRSGTGGNNLPTPAALTAWSALAARLKDAPCVIFDLLEAPRMSEPNWDVWRNGGTLAGESYAGMQELVRVIRAQGAMQPILVEGLGGSLADIGAHLLDDRNVIYGARLDFAESNRTPADWDRAFGFLAGRAPVMVVDWQLPNGTNACADLDRGSATQLAFRFFVYAEQQSISWTAWTAPGIGRIELLRLSLSSPTLSEDPLPADWGCASPQGYGLAPLVLWYLTRNPNGLEVLRIASAADGSSGIAPGSIATAQGTGLARDSATAQTVPLPTRLLDVGLDLTDSSGWTFEVPLLSVSPSSITFVVPPEAATGLALVRHVRPLAPGVENRFTSTVTIWKTAVSFFPMAVLGIRFAAGSLIPETFDVYRCRSMAIGGINCAPVPIEMPPGATVYLSLYGTGIRGRSSLEAVRVRIGEAILPVQYAGPHGSLFGMDQVNVLLPESLRGRGWMDLAVSVDGVLSNTMQIVIQ